jgi:hypothetical protein
MIKQSIKMLTMWSFEVFSILDFLPKYYFDDHINNDDMKELNDF